MQVRRSRADLAVSSVVVVAAVAMVAVRAALTENWSEALGVLFGVAAALALLVPLFWLLNHPRRPRGAQKSAVRARSIR